MIEIVNSSEQDEIILKRKLKYIFKEVESSFMFYKTVLDEETFNKLQKLQNYVKTLNCSMESCFYDVLTLNEYVSQTFNANEIEELFTKLTSISENFKKKSTSLIDANNLKILKLSPNIIQSHPYFMDSNFFSEENGKYFSNSIDGFKVFNQTNLRRPLSQLKVIENGSKETHISQGSSTDILDTSDCEPTLCKRLIIDLKVYLKN